MKNNLSDIELKPFYEKSSDINLGKPGEYPFTRGVYPTMYRGKPWTMRQYAGFGSAKESNARYKKLLEKGQTGLSVAFDLPTQMGFDSDHKKSIGEVGKVGVAISSIEDMEILLNQIPLDKVSTSMTINSTAMILLSFYIATAQKRGIDPKVLRGTIQNDILKEYIARGTYIYPPMPSLRLITDIFSYCKDNLPNWNSISVSGYHIREAGSTAVEELAFTFSNAFTYIEHALRAGMKIDDFAPQISFFFNVQNDFFEEIAKFRAARSIWAKTLKNKYSAKNESSLKMRFHSQTAGSSLTAQQPENNLVRVAYQAMAAALGGTQSLHTNSMDEALGLPTEKAATLALRTQQVLAFETGITDVADPLAGSFYLESLTHELEVRATKLIEQIEKQDGVIKNIENGWIQKQIQNSAYKYQKLIESKECKIVGVNDFINEKEEKPKLLKVSPAVQKSQVQRLKKFKSKRNKKVIGAYLEKIKNVAGGKNNLMPIVIESVENKVTLGEISDALRSVFGEYKERVTL